MLAKKAYGCHKLLPCMYKNVLGEQGDGCLKGIKPNCSPLCNETSGKWAETTLCAALKSMSICIFPLCCHPSTDSVGSDKELVGRAHWNWSQSKGRSSCFPLNLLMAITGELSGPTGGWSRENLLLLHHLLWGKNRSKEICFPVSWMYPEPCLHLVPVSQGCTLSVFSTEYKASCTTLATARNSHVTLRELPVPQQRLLLITAIPLGCVNLVLVAAVALCSCIDCLPVVRN